MILILSQSNDYSTTEVIEWLNFYKKKWIRINYQDKIEIDYVGDDIIFNVNNFSFPLSEIKSFWYRRGLFNVKYLNFNIEELDEYLKSELKDIINFVYFKLTKIHHLDSIRSSNVNKLIVNSIANELGLLTPSEYLVSTRKSLLKILDEKDSEFITKAISGNPSLFFKKFIAQNFTSKISINDLSSPVFFPSLVQNKIEKKYELRIFYFKGDFYCMAIFSQNDKQTTIDFRNYNDNKPNRRVPFNLPERIKNKIRNLMDKLNLDTGSIDMIVSQDDEYIFLEVNPVGQFSMTSFPCNYNIEKKIAQYLSNENK